MKQLLKFLLFSLLTLLSIPANTSDQNANYYILQSPNLADAQAACQNYGFTMVSTVHAPDTFLVAAEQASKRLMQEPTRPGFGEDRS